MTGRVSNRLNQLSHCRRVHEEGSVDMYLEHCEWAALLLGRVQLVSRKQKKEKKTAIRGKRLRGKMAHRRVELEKGMRESVARLSCRPR